MKKIHLNRVAAVSIILATAILCLTAARFDPIRGVNTGVSANEMAWQQITTNSEEEHLFMIGFFEGGIQTFTTIFMFKYGPFNRWGFYTLLHEDSKDKTIFVKGECPEKTTKPSRTNYDITCGDASYSGNWPDYTLKIHDPELTGDIKFHSIVPAFGVGKAFYSQDAVAECIVYLPRAKTEANLSFGGKSVKLAGEGYADHNHQSYPFTRQGSVYYAVRAFPDPKTPPDEQIYLNFSMQEIHKGYGGGNDSFMFAARKDKILGVSRKLAITPLEQVTDPDSGYKYVRRVSIKVDDPAISFTGIFTAAKTIEVMDIFKWLPAYARKLAATLFKRPVYFRFLGTVEGQLKTKEGNFIIRQRATSEMNFTQ